jgi:glycosyltransferase involved in cell wall biosynthesis
VTSDISVIIPTVTPRRELLARALASVGRQTLQPDTVHISDDVDRIGGARNRQRALDRVTTYLTAPLDDDDEFLPHHLEVLADEMERTGADLIFGWFHVIGGTDPFPWAEGKPWDDQEPHQVPVTWLAETEVIRSVGGFAGEWDVTQAEDPGIDAAGNRAGEDYRLILRLINAGAKIVHLNNRTWNWYHWLDGSRIGNSMGLPSRVNWT